jgi:hypothetical protein
MFPKICWKHGESRRRSELSYFPADSDLQRDVMNRSSDLP